MTLPNFLIIGAGRTGTTSLYNYLSQHPQIFMSKVKEPVFFGYENRTSDFSGPTGSISLPDYSTKLNEYEKLFSDVKDEIAIGEASVDYFYLKEAPERIKYHIPDVKLILLLRQPVDRAYSQFWARVAAGIEPLVDFEQALELESQRIEKQWPPYYHYKQKSFYASSLKRYFQLFDRSQIKIILYDDYNKNIKQTMTEISQFVGVTSDFKFNFNSRYNSPLGLAKSTLINKLFNSNNSIRLLLKFLIPVSLIPYLRNAYYSNGFSKRPSLDKELRQKLTGIYKEDIIEVQKLINKDLSNWMK